MKPNILVPMVGRGQRFKDAGYKEPKQLIMVGHQQMIDWSLSCIDYSNSNLIFIIRKDTVDEWNMDKVLYSKFGENIKIVISDGDTDGTVSSCLLAKDYIDNDSPLSITTLDMYFVPHFNPLDMRSDVDGTILTFWADNPAYSYSEINGEGIVLRTAEKELISNHASVGLYHFTRGSDFVKYSKEMVKRNTRTKNEFYVCPLYNLFIEDGKKIITHEIDSIYSMGTPDERSYFLENQYENLQY